MQSTFGKYLRLSVSGTSHGAEVSATLSGIPAGIPLGEEALALLMQRRQGGNSPFTTPRKESDIPLFLSGITDGITNGEEIKVVVRNENMRSGDYQPFRDTPRPSHVDYTAPLRYGNAIDLRGGGHFSARLTAPLCALGHICRQALLAQGVVMQTHLAQIGNVRDTLWEEFSLKQEQTQKQVNEQAKEEVKKDAKEDAKEEAQSFTANTTLFPVFNPAILPKMQEEIACASRELDSVGGVIECITLGMPPGVGDPLFDGIENRLSSAMFALGGVRGIEFGTGFRAAGLRGSEHNDAFSLDGEKVVTKTNHAGGILGGMTSGMPIVFRVAFKPTASIGKTQKTLSLKEQKEVPLNIQGRHDPCIVLRALPCVEALTAFVLYDLFLGKEMEKPDET